MTVPFVDLYRQYLSIKDEVDAAMRSVIEESAFIRSRFVTEFEREFAVAVGVDRCVSCANGTDALYVAMKALGLRPGDEVITTAHSWISTSETITQADGHVVFVDTDATTFTIDPARIEEKITDRTVGIIPVHLYGQPADMDPILRVARAHGLWVIEDCAQAHMAEYKGRKVGTMGQMATFSFYPGKNLGAMGDAGCLVTNDETLADWCELYARHGGKGEHVMEGINSRMDGLQAAILSVKLPRLDAWTAARRQVAAAYDTALAGIEWLATPRIAEQRTHVYHLYVIRTRYRDALREHLTRAGIGTMLNYPRALPFYPAYARLGHRPADFPNAYAAQGEILSLPIFPEMSASDTELVCSSIRGFRP
ncbi:MAG: DegT/DnrJ/EryC1/StrS family aminotransferase [Steroidobacteraceae bacterium]